MTVRVPYAYVIPEGNVRAVAPRGRQTDIINT